MVAAQMQARLDGPGHQAVEVTVRDGYHPATIVARAGVPLRIVFHRRDADPCSERVVFSSPRIERRLAAVGATAVELPAQPAGEIRFTCAMGRYRGQIQFVDGTAGSFTVRARTGARRLRTPLGSALTIWFFALPLVGVVTALLLDLTAAVIAVLLGLVASIAGCLWAFRSSARLS